MKIVDILQEIVHSDQFRMLCAILGFIAIGVLTIKLQAWQDAREQHSDNIEDEHDEQHA